jgi:hypothetical protein
VFQKLREYVGSMGSSTRLPKEVAKGAPQRDTMDPEEILDPESKYGADRTAEAVPHESMVSEAYKQDRAGAAEFADDEVAESWAEEVFGPRHRMSRRSPR